MDVVRNAGGRGGARFCRLLPCLALLLGALLPFSAAQAQAVWSSTLTVQDDENRGLGCFGTKEAACKTALSDNDFVLDGTTYTVTGLDASSNQDGTIHYLHLVLDRTIPEALKSLKLCVDTTGLGLADGRISDASVGYTNNGVRWSSFRGDSVPTGWSAGDEVSLRLDSACATEFDLDQAAYLVKENLGSFVLAVTASQAVAADTTITISRTDGTSTPSDPSAERGSDYGGDATFEVTMKTGSDRAEFTQAIIDNNVVEEDEKFTLTITGVSAGAVGSQGSAVVTIEDNDVAVAFESAAYDVAEDSQTAVTVVLTATGDLSSDFSVGLSYASLGTTAALSSGDACADNADSDHLAVPGTVTFLANQTRAEIQVTACNNDDRSEDPRYAPEYDESFTLTLNIEGTTGLRVASSAWTSRRRTTARRSPTC